MNARALDAEGDAQVDAGPAGVRLPTVAAAGVAREGQDLLQGALALQGPLLRLAAGVQAARGCGRLPVQLLGETAERRGGGGVLERSDETRVKSGGRTSPSSPLSRKAVAMLFWTALIQACRSFSESACRMQLLWGDTHRRHRAAAGGGGAGALHLPSFGALCSGLLGGGHHLEAEAALDVLAVFDRAQPQVLHHHRGGVLEVGGGTGSSQTCHKHTHGGLVAAGHAFLAAGLCAAGHLTHLKLLAINQLIVLDGEPAPGSTDHRSQGGVTCTLP